MFLEQTWEKVFFLCVNNYLTNYKLPLYNHIIPDSEMRHFKHNSNDSKYAKVHVSIPTCARGCKYSNFVVQAS